MTIRYTNSHTPTPTPTPPATTISAVARRTGQSVHAVHAAQGGAAVPVPGLLSITDTPRASGRTRTLGQTRTRNTPYGANSSLAVPPGGFSARAATAPAPTPTAPTPTPTPQISASVQAIARKHMLKIAKRHASTRTTTSTQRAATAKQRRRGQTAVFPEETGQAMGKRKQQAPPRGSAILMDGAAPNSNRSRTAPLGGTPGTQYFRLDRG